MMRALLVSLVTLGLSSIVLGQTNAAKASAVGTWKTDISHSDFGSEPAPQSVTLTIMQDEPQMLSWRVTLVDEKGKSFSYSWKGAKDGTMHPISGPDGKEIGKESAKMDGDALLRHGVDATDGSSFDARDTMSADGNTITDVVTSKSKDGKTSKQTIVMHRAPASK